MIGRRDPIPGTHDIINRHDLSACQPLVRAAKRPSRIFGRRRAASTPKALSADLAAGPQSPIDDLVVGVITVAEIHSGRFVGVGASVPSNSPPRPRDEGAPRSSPVSRAASSVTHGLFGRGCRGPWDPARPGGAGARAEDERRRMPQGGQGPP